MNSVILALLSGLLLLTSCCQGHEPEGLPSESECRPYIEKALQGVGNLQNGEDKNTSKEDNENLAISTEDNNLSNDGTSKEHDNEDNKDSNERHEDEAIENDEKIEENTLNENQETIAEETQSVEDNVKSDEENSAKETQSIEEDTEETVDKLFDEKVEEKSIENDLKSDENENISKIDKSEEILEEKAEEMQNDEASLIDDRKSEEETTEKDNETEEVIDDEKEQSEELNNDKQESDEIVKDNDTEEEKLSEEIKEDIDEKSSELNEIEDQKSMENVSKEGDNVSEDHDTEKESAEEGNTEEDENKSTQQEAEGSVEEAHSELEKEEEEEEETKGESKEVEAQSEPQEEKKAENEPQGDEGAQNESQEIEEAKTESKEEVEEDKIESKEQEETQIESKEQEETQSESKEQEEAQSESKEEELEAQSESKEVKEAESEAQEDEAETKTQEVEKAESESKEDVDEAQNEPQIDVEEAESEPQVTEESPSEPPEEEELSMVPEIPEKLRSRDHMYNILHLDSDTEDTEKILSKTIDTTLKELKKLYDAAIKPLEILYKYRDLSNRHFGDPEIFSKPLILFMGPWSGGKSTIINYLLENEYKHTALRTGADPSPAYFNIVMWGDEPEIVDGTQLAADWTFSGLQKFGQGLLDRLRGLKLNHPLLEKVNIVEIPGILEIRKQVERLFPFNDACQWFIDRADIIFLVYDPSKLDIGPETEAILDQLKGREMQTRIILNKADQVKPEELMRVQGTLIWNISPLMSSTEPPVMYSTSLWSVPYEAGSPTRLLLAQEKAFLTDLRSAIDKRVENKIAGARRFAVRVRNHAKMVDCYLTTYYNHKSIFDNKKHVSDDIIEHPQNYHIYEGLSTLTNISRYDLPDPETYRDFFRLNPVYEFQQLSATCTYFRGCPINRLDLAIAYDLPELIGKYKKSVEDVLKTHNKQK